jgi:cysteine-rich repeat protein
VCGDGLVNQPAGEQCDDGNLDPLDGCDATCQDTGMVARWRLDEHVGRIAFDTGSYKYHGDLQGGANFQDGFGLPLDGTSDYVSVSISKTLDVIGKITLMALVKPNLPLADGFHDIIGHNSPGKETWLRFNGSTLQGGSWDGAEGLVAFNVNWQISNWHHVAARYNGTRWSFLLDGVLVASADTNKGAQDIEGPWEIGGRSDGRYLAGSIADVRVYDRDLDNDTILAIAKAGIKAANTL